ncbi:MAG: helix-turn-helix domain-containing protein [Candidatus Binataceae bacterium]
MPHAKEKWVKGGPNVFADLGLPNAGELLIETELLRRIAGVIRTRGLSQRAAAAILGVDQPKVCALMNIHPAGFSIARLIKFLNALGQDVEIRVSPKPRSRVRASTRVAA